MNKQQRLAEMREMNAFLDQVAAGTYVSARESARRAAERHERFLREHGARMPVQVRKEIERSIADAKRVADGQQVSMRYQTADYYSVKAGEA